MKTHASLRETRIFKTVRLVALATLFASSSTSSTTWAAPRLAIESVKPKRGTLTSEKRIEKMDLSGADLTFAGFVRSELSSVSGTGLIARQSRFDRTKIFASRWPKSDFRGSQWARVFADDLVVSESRYDGAKLIQSTIEDSDFSGTTWAGAYVADTKFRRVKLPSSIQRDALLINVDFEDCIFGR